MEIYHASKDSTNYFSNRPVHVNSAGAHMDKLGRLAVIRENGRVDYHILFCFDGSLKISTKSGYETLCSGDFAVFYPNQMQRYTYDSIKLSYWVHFSGTYIDEILSSLRLRAGIYRASADSAVQEHFETLLGCYKLRSAYGGNLPAHLENSEDLAYRLKESEIRSAGALMQLLSRLSHLAYTPKGRSVSKSFTDYVNTHFEEKADIDYFAETEGLSRHRYNTLFKEETGFSPHSYQTSVRLSEAKWLLKYSNLNVSEIAQRIGYSDPLYFSRIFKKHVSLSPLEYKAKRR